MLIEIRNKTHIINQIKKTLKKIIKCQNLKEIK